MKSAKLRGSTKVHSNSVVRLISRLEFTPAAAHFAMVHSYTSGTVVAELLERGPDVTTSGTPKGAAIEGNNEI
jgi:hypothetical protein